MPANSIWLWGQGRRPAFPAFYEKYGTDGAVVAAVDLIKGIGALAGFDTPRVEGATGYLDTDYGAKARCAPGAARASRYRLRPRGGAGRGVPRGEPPREDKGHRADRREGRGLSARADGEDVRLLVVTDHATPLSMRTHYACPVPFAIFQKGRKARAGRHLR